MLLFDGEADPLHLPARAKEVVDVSGAGDTAIAVFTLGLVSGGAGGGGRTRQPGQRYRGRQSGYGHRDRGGTHGRHPMPIRASLMVRL